MTSENRKQRIYVASSWRNERQPEVVAALDAAGHDVYDFRHPAPGNDGFHWSEIDRDWRSWSPEQFRQALRHPAAVVGFRADMGALAACDACVLVLPCGRSAHLELGFAVAARKRTVVFMPRAEEPELMYRMCGAVCTTLNEVLAMLGPTPPASATPEDVRRYVDGVALTTGMDPEFAATSAAAVRARS